MGLITIGGQSAYIIDSKPAEVGRTSTGVGYAQLVSQQRWKIWEQAEKQVLRQMEFEKMGYQAQLDAYAKQKAQLQKSLLKTQEVKDKIKNGDYTFSQGLQLIRMVRQREDAEIRDKMVSRTTTETFDKYGQPITITSTRDKYLPDENLRRSDIVSSLERAKDQLGIETPKDKRDAAVAELETEWKKQFANRTDKSLDETAWAKSEEGKEIEDKLAAERAKPLSDYAGTKDELKEFDEEISSLEKQLAALSVPEVDFDTNVLSRTRETFGGMAGVGGLGFAPRRSKISPIYDEGRAREALAAQRQGADEAIALAASKNADDLRASVLSGKDIRTKARIQELEASKAVAGPEDAEFVKLIDAEIQKLSVPSVLTAEEESNIARTSRNAALQDFRSTALETGPGERTAGQFMSRYEPPSARPPGEDKGGRERKERKDTDFNFLANLGKLAGEGIPSVYFGSGEDAEAGLSGIAPQGAITTPGQPPEDPALMGPDYSGFGPGVGFGATTMPESGAPREPSESDSNFRKTMQRLRTDIGGMQPGDSAPSPVTISGEAGIGGPAYMATPPFKKPPEGKVTTENENIKKGGREKAAEDLYVFYAPRTDDGEELKPLNNLQKQQIWDKWLAEEETTSTLDEAGAKAWYADAIKSLDTGAQKKKTRSETYASNLLKIIKTGKDLADKPAKLARIAKPDLPEKERSKVVPEHILLVDKLYNINKGRSGAFKSTYDEIERVYKTDEKKKKAALEYLAAKEILTSEIA